MVRAAACGAIDFAKADPRDRWWWKRTEFILEEVARRDRLEVLRSHNRHYAGLLGNGSLESGAFQDTQRSSADIVGDIFKLLYPWHSELAAAQDLVQQWYDIYGDPNSPETAAMIETAIATMQNAPISSHVTEDD